VQLTQAQKTTLRTHMQANTNVTPTPGVGGAAFAVNTRLATRNADDQQAIADWYNRTASAADKQPLAAPLTVWIPTFPVMDPAGGPNLNSAVNWQQPFAGTASADQTVSLLTYLAMTQGGGVDMTDQGVRKGLAQVFGTAGASATANAVGAAGQRPGSTAELLLAGPGVGPNGLGTAAARRSPVYGQTLTPADVEDILLNG
jgi:hypothetical protein